MRTSADRSSGACSCSTPKREAALAPGERVVLDDGRRAQVVLAETIDEGGQEFLAVTTLPGMAGSEDAVADAGAPSPVQRIPSMQVPLPYELPA